MKRYFKARITEKGEFISNKQTFKNGIKTLPPGDYILVLLKTSDRTLRENQNYYFTQIGEWGVSVGETKMFIHDLVKDELFMELFNEPISTSDMTEEQWGLLFFNLENFLIGKYENI